MASGPDTPMTFPRADCYRCADGTEYGVDSTLAMPVFAQHVAELQEKYGAVPVGAVVTPVITEADADADPER